MPLVERIIDQTERRVLHGEKVPAADKLVSLFEPHSDIIVKSRRQVSYGHKLNLASGASGLILDVVVEQGNPADAERFVPMVDRQIAIYGRPPRQLAADGGFASTGNLAAAKNKGVEDVAFHKKCGLAITDMVKSRWVYRRLRNFRAGIEAAISCLKRAYGLGRCTWKGLEHFKSYVWAAVVAPQPRRAGPPQTGIAANPTRPIHQHRRPPIPPACLDHAPLVTGTPSLDSGTHLQPPYPQNTSLKRAALH